MLKYWLTTLILITCFSGLIYATVQHSLRMDANDPQIQIAEDTAANLANGQPAQSVLPRTTIDIGKSLAPFVIVYDPDGQPTAASGKLNGQIPWLPAGVLQNVKQNGQDRITWQPQPGVRIAAVITAYSGANEGYVLAGRSLREVENREDDLMFEVTVAWLVTLVIATIPFSMELRKKPKKKPVKRK